MARSFLTSITNRLFSAGPIGRSPMDRAVGGNFYHELWVHIMKNFLHVADVLALSAAGKALFRARLGVSSVERLFVCVYFLYTFFVYVFCVHMHMFVFTVFTVCTSTARAQSCRRNMALACRQNFAEHEHRLDNPEGR